MADHVVPPYSELLWPTLVAVKEHGDSASIEEIVGSSLKNESFSDEQQSILHGGATRQRKVNRVVRQFERARHRVLVKALTNDESQRRPHAQCLTQWFGLAKTRSTRHRMIDVLQGRLHLTSVEQRVGQHHQDVYLE